MSEAFSEGYMLPEPDVRAMVRLLADVAATKGGVIAQKKRLMEGIAELSGTDYWMWNVGHMDLEEKKPVAVSVLHNLSEKQLALITEEAYCDKGAHAAYTHSFIDLTAEHKQWTRRLEDMVDLEDPQIHTRFYIHKREVDMAYSLFAFHRVPGQDQMYSGVGLHRAHGRDPYTEREMRIAHILIGEVDWLHKYGVPEGEDGTAMAQLSPRTRTVQTLLVDGMTVKRIAYQLGLSEHTVKDYVKAIYKHYGISSRHELLRRFMVGGV